MSAVDTQADDGVELGPVDYLVVEFPQDRRPDGTAFPLLVDLVDRDIIRILDLAFVRRNDDGSVDAVAITDLNLEGDIDVALLGEASSGLIDDDDRAEAGAILEPGAVAGIIVYENRWAEPFATALRRNGVQLVASGRIPADVVHETLAALDDDTTTAGK